MECICTKLALHGSKNECPRTDTVFLPISEVCDDTVPLSATEKSRIRETPTLSTAADSKTDTNLKRLRDLSKKSW